MISFGALMRVFLVLSLLTALPAASQTLTRRNVATILGFENGQAGASPAGWSGSPANTIVVDDKVVHSGKFSARIERTASSANTFSYLIAAIPMDFAGKTIEFRGFLKTENVSDAVAVWMREDGATPNLAFATSQGLGVRGTTDWREYAVSLNVVPDAKSLVFGFLLSGTGVAWGDDFRLLVDGKPISEAPDRTLTPLDTDQEFNDGSLIEISELGETQIQNLARLAKIWGFLKYHHPAVTSGQRHWDYELFRILPQVLVAGDGTAANQVISAWIATLGNVPDCTTCATLDPANLYLGTNLDWLGDESSLGPELSQTLLAIYRNRTPANKSFYVSLAPGVGNPVFENELTYSALKLPDAGYQLLALFRYWNMVQYFYPNRDVMADDPAEAATYWDKVLIDSIPLIGLAKTSLSYQQELMKFIAKIHDTHANLWSSLSARPPIGPCQFPVDIRFVEGRAFVVRHNTISGQAGSTLRPGDILDQIDGVPVDDLVQQWKPFYAASNDAARLRDLGNFLTRGNCGSVPVQVFRAGQLVPLTVSRVASNTLNLTLSSTHDRAGATFQMLSPDVAYLKLSSVEAAKAASYVQSAARTRGMIIDIRNYPSEFVVFALGNLLVSDRVDFARFTNGDVTNPGAFRWTAPIGLTPQQPRYPGKVVILVDEISQSQSEYTTMAFRTAPGSLVIGSTTAGADGNISAVPLPGGFSSYISGIGVFYPDNRPTQRIGILPDIEVKPTIEGLSQGRDEVLDRAFREIAGISWPGMSLTVQKTGTGTISSDPAGLSCDAACTTVTRSFTADRVVLTASPATEFRGWSGACSGSAPTCSVILDGAKTVIAAFGAPLVLNTLSVSPATVAGGSNSTGTITLNAPAPASGTVVSLESSNTNIATVPASVTVASGQTSATFTVTTKTVTATQTAVITARAGVESKAANLTVSAPVVTLFTTSFDSPGYTVGALSPQNNWFMYGSVNASGGQVQTSTVKSGNQAVSITASASATVVMPLRSVMIPATGVVEAAISMRREANGTSWLPLCFFSPSGNQCLGVSTAGFAYVTNFSVSSPAISAGALSTWVNLRLRLDFTARTISGYANGNPIAAIPLPAAINGGTVSLGFGFNNGILGASGTTVAYFDDLSVSSGTP